MNIALAVTQALALMLSALLVSAVGGFSLLSVVSDVTALAGVFAVNQVKGVRCQPLAGDVLSGPGLLLRQQRHRRP